MCDSVSLKSELKLALIAEILRQVSQMRVVAQEAYLRKDGGKSALVAATSMLGERELHSIAEDQGVNTPGIKVARASIVQASVRMAREADQFMGRVQALQEVEEVLGSLLKAAEQQKVLEKAAGENVEKERPKSVKAERNRKKAKK